MGKLSAVTLALLQDQYRHEMSNSLRYSARASWARFRGLESTADFFDKEAEGERGHAAVVKKWIEERNEALIPEPYSYQDSSLFDSYDILFVTAMEIELDTTERLSKIYRTAFAEGDFQLVGQVEELIKEQIEEENLYQTILDRIAQRGKDFASVHDIDIWIGERFVK